MKKFIMIQQSDSPPGTALMTVTATDVDLNPLLIYDFKSQGNPNQIFSMDHFNGEIFLATTLNYEERSQYTLEIQVRHMKIIS